MRDRIVDPQLLVERSGNVFAGSVAYSSWRLERRPGEENAQ